MEHGISMREAPSSTLLQNIHARKHVAERFLAGHNEKLLGSIAGGGFRVRNVFFEENHEPFDACCFVLGCERVEVRLWVMKGEKIETLNVESFEKNVSPIVESSLDLVVKVSAGEELDKTHLAYHMIRPLLKM